jgi:hypothetical protein
MGHTNQTTNLHLPQFIGSDKPTWLSDVNGAMLAIDNAYGTIEADAASAVSAANNAVTTAGTASSTATSASEAAATAASNASTALNTANNAASTANNAYNEAHEALARVNGVVLAEVVADGVKTTGQIIAELFSGVSSGDLSMHSKITEVLATGVTVVFSANVLGTTIAYTRNSVQHDKYVSETINATGNMYHAELGTSNTFSNLSSNVPDASTIYRIYR